MKKINILIADDHQLVRESWATLLNADDRFEVVASCGNVDEAIATALEKKPSIVLMDINIPPSNGFEATERLQKEAPDCKVIGVSMHSQPAYAKKMLQLGGRGYITKNSSKEEMFTAILQVEEGETYVCEEIQQILSKETVEEEGVSTGIQTLTEREIQIVNHIREGLSSREIADKLNITLKTVEVHRHNILRKLKVKNATSLISLINNSSTHV
jgi:DNA-binding NarL/FixJ family response regulator